MCPLYIAGLIGPGERKNIQPMAERLASGEYDQLHHFVSAGVWDAVPLEGELLIQADRLVGGRDAVLVIDDTALPKTGIIRSGSRRNTLRLWARRPIARRWYR
jgi:SRSO17 transposase